MEFKQFIHKYGSEIVFGTCVAGVIGSSVGAVIVTPKANAEMQQKQTKKEKFLAALKHYALPGAGLILSLGGIIAVHVSKNKQISNLAIGLAASEKLYSDYKDKVVEFIGEKKENQVQDELAKDKVENSDIPKDIPKTFVLDQTQRCLCFDMYTGIYFESNKQLIENGVNRANSDLIEAGYLSLDDFYYNIGLNTKASVGMDHGWSYERDGLIKVEFTSILKDGEIPVLAIRFAKRPHESFDSFA